jgi:hypothetical protein
MATQYKPNPTRAELREEAKKEEVAPPRGETKKEADTFKEGMKPPKDDEGPVKKETPRKLPPGVKSADEIIRALRPDLYPEKPSEKIYKAKGGSVKSASARADGCAIRGKTRA